MSTWKLRLFALTLATFVSIPAYAQDTASSSATSAVATASGSVSTPSPISEIDAPAKKSFKERLFEGKKALVQGKDALKRRFNKKKIARQNELKNMTPEERQTLKLNFEEWFKALPLEKQDEIRTRNTTKKKVKTKEAVKVKDTGVTTSAAPVSAPVSAPEEVQKILSEPTAVPPTPIPAPEPVGGM